MFSEFSQKKPNSDVFDSTSDLSHCGLMLLLIEILIFACLVLIEQQFLFVKHTLINL